MSSIVRIFVAGFVIVSTSLGASPFVSYAATTKLTAYTTNVTDNKVSITWSFSGKTPKRQMLTISAPSIADKIVKLQANVRSYTLYAASPSTEYTFRLVGFEPTVRYVLYAQTKPGTQFPSQSPSREIPQPPISLMVGEIVNGIALLSWSRPTYGATAESYQIEISNDGSTFLVAGRVEGKHSSANLSNLDKSTTYYLRVRSVVGAAESEPSTIVKLIAQSPHTGSATNTTPTSTPAPTTPQAPTSLTVVAEAELGKVKLTWRPPTTGPAPEKYIIEVTDGKVPFTLAGYVNAPGVTVTMGSLTPGVNYSFRVTSMVGTMSSIPSEISGITIPNGSTPNSAKTCTPITDGKLNWGRVGQTIVLSVTARHASCQGLESFAMYDVQTNLPTLGLATYGTIRQGSYGTDKYTLNEAGGIIRLYMYSEYLSGGFVSCKPNYPFSYPGTPSLGKPSASEREFISQYNRDRDAWENNIHNVKYRLKITTYVNRQELVSYTEWESCQ